MAVLQKYTIQEAVNVEVSSVWDVQTAVTSSSSTTYHINASDYHTIVLQNNDDIYLLFDQSATTNIDTSNDLKVPSGITTIKIPQGIRATTGGKIYAHWARVNATSTTVRSVLC